METRVNDLTISEFKALIASTVQEIMEEFQEDALALASPSYLQSIEEARQDYQSGNITPLDEL